MKTVVSLVALLGSATAFAPSSTLSGSKSAPLAATAELDSLFGVDIETGKKIFDPLGLAQWAPVDFLRKAELSNGRSAMLATVGWAWPSLVGHFDSQDVTTTDPIDAIMQADPQWWAQWVLICGTIEAMKYRAEQEGKSYTGDGPAAFDWARQWDKLDAKGKEDMRLKELKNGRLAMIGFAGFLFNPPYPWSLPRATGILSV